MDTVNVPQDMANVLQDIERVYVDIENVSLDMVHVSYGMFKVPSKCQLWYGNVYLDMINVAQYVIRLSMDKYIFSLMRLCPCPDNRTM
jgi:hypothetical protein